MRRVSAALLLLLSTLVAVPAAADAFPRPAELEPAIRFWTQVYSGVSTEGGLLHDRRNLEVVYETVRFAEDASQNQRRAHVDERRAHYEGILRRLAEGRRDDLSAEEQRVLDLFPDDVDNATLGRAASEVRFQLGQSDRFRRGLIRAGAWEPHIRRTLEEMGLPREIAALPHVESSFNPNAYSRVGAAGIWQFTRATGRRFMRVDHIIDERMDPFAATVAAARLLQHNYSVTNDWALALSAYNHGLAGIRRAARATGSDNIADIIRDHEGRNWGFASRNFYPAFLAAVDVDFQAHKYFGLLDREDPIVSETIELPFYADIDDLVRAFEVSPSELRELNRALRPPVWNGEKLVPRGYSLRVPASPERPPAAEMLARIDSDNRYYAQIPDRYHRVSRGESVSAIAQRYGVSARELVSLNNLRSADHIRVGQELRLPVAGAAPIRGNTYIVEHGDNLSLIAQRSGMSVSALAAANNIDPSRPIQPGQELQVDGRSVDEPDTTAVAEADTAERSDEAPEQEPAPDDEGAAATPAETVADAADAAGMAPSADEEVTAGTDTEALADADTTAPVAATREPGSATPATPSTTQEVLAALMPAGMADESIDADAADDAAAGERPQLGGAIDDELAADPSDYSVAGDGTIEVQAAETLGHYAEWLDLRASELRRLNGMSHGSPVVIGHRVELDFRRVARDEFEERRREYHEALQARFFDQFRITGTEEHEIQRGDSLWTLARRHDNIPVWLLRQYNPDLDFERLHPGMAFNLPRVERHEDPDGDHMVRDEG